MDSKIEIKEEDPLSDDIASHDERKFFHNVVGIKRNSNAMLLDNDNDTAFKTEIKSESPFTKHTVKQIKSETCSYKHEIDRITEIEEIGSQNEGNFLPEAPLIKAKKYNSNDEMDYKIDIKEEPWWLEMKTSPVYDEIKDGHFPPVKSSRLCTEAVSGSSSSKCPLPSTEVSGRDASFCNAKDHLEYEHQKSDITEMPTAEKHVSERSSKFSDGEGKYIRPLCLKQKFLIHKGKRSHKCNICAKAFDWLSHLKRHNMIHEGNKPHQCETCDKSFVTLSHLKRHNLVHEGKKPYQCETCHKSFTQVSHLKSHNLIHEGKKLHQCKTCDKSFTLLGNLKQHILIHEGKKPHQCKTCERSFTYSSDLKKHNLIHEGKKPHQCKTCDQSFTLLENLKQHNLIHEGKKSHQCKTCSKSFIRLSNLKRHNLTHKGKNLQ